MGIKHRVLVLGAGRVAAPLVEYLIRDPSLKLSVVSAISKEIESFKAKFPSSTTILLDVLKSMDKLENLVSENDLVISLLPPHLHASIAVVCIANKTNMVTASYISQDMKNLQESAVDAGITMFQEIGLDPGIDYLLAMECFDQVKEEGGKIVSFKSYCGGLPSPEAANNPLKYKFSWCPRSALKNLFNGAKYLQDGEIVEVQPGKLMETAHPLDLFPGFSLEGYPNRDSIAYIEKFSLEGIKTMLRGTIRYRDSSDVCIGILRLGCLDPSPREGFEDGKETTWCEVINNLIGTQQLSGNDLATIVYDKIGRNDIALKGLQGLGLLSDRKIIMKSTPLDTLSSYLSVELAYEPGERDLVLLHHRICIDWPDGRKETRDISLVEYGAPDGHSAMAKTVGLPAAIASKMILEGEIVTKGNVAPLRRELYEPILKQLSVEGIRWTTNSTFE